MSWTEPYLLLILIPTCLLPRTVADIVKPKLCQRLRFDGIWNYGPYLEIMWREADERRWVWQYNRTSGQFNDEPELEYTKDQDMTTLTTLYFPELPKCISINCDQLTKAKDLIFERKRPIKSQTESTAVYRVIGERQSPTDNNWIKDVEPKDIPFGLIDPNDVWPNKEWSNQPMKSRNSVYWPLKGTVIQIVYTAVKHMSTLKYNSIANNEWYWYMKEMKLNMNTNFVGMFHLNEMVYAVGDEGLSGDYETRVYSVIFDDSDRPEITTLNKTLREFFGCYPPTEPPPKGQPTKVASSERTSSTNRLRNSGGKPNEESFGTQMWVVFIVVVVVLVTVILVTLILTIFVHERASSANKADKSNETLVTVNTLATMRTDDKKTNETEDNKLLPESVASPAVSESPKSNQFSAEFK